MQIAVQTDQLTMMQDISCTMQITRPETGKLECSSTNTDIISNCFTNTGSNSNLSSSNALMPMVNNDEIKYFLPGPN